MSSDDEKEKKHFQKVVMNFQNYKSVMTNQIDKIENIFSLKVEHQYGIKRDFPLIRTLIDHNQTIINEIINGEYRTLSSNGMKLT